MCASSPSPLSVASYVPFRFIGWEHLLSLSLSCPCSRRPLDLALTIITLSSSLPSLISSDSLDDTTLLLLVYCRESLRSFSVLDERFSPFPYNLSDLYSLCLYNLSMLITYNGKLYMKVSRDRTPRVPRLENCHRLPGIVHTSLLVYFTFAGTCALSIANVFPTALVFARLVTDLLDI